MKTLHTRRGGFTLIELMIVVAIIGILAAIAIPNFLRFQLRAKSSEGKTNLAAIRTAEEGYNAEFGTYVVAATNPALLPGSSKVVWNLAAPAPVPGFDQIGWSPEGDVFFQYTVTGTGANPEPVYTSTAVADIDGDAVTQTWGYVKPLPGGAGAVAVGVCPATGVYNPVSMLNDLLETVGPCDATSGQSIF
jgi:type IV pilus assembly protein PilA